MGSLEKAAVYAAPSTGKGLNMLLPSPVGASTTILPTRSGKRVAKRSTGPAPGEPP